MRSYITAVVFSVGLAGLTGCAGNPSAKLAMADKDRVDEWAKAHCQRLARAQKQAYATCYESMTGDAYRILSS